MLAAGIRVESDLYSKYDALESNDDLTSLLELLIKYKDSYGRHPIITANMIACNPDFEKIEQGHFQDYHFEYFTETLKKYAGSSNVRELWHQGMFAGMFRPQFHGREHVNVSLWMQALREGNKDLILAFHHQVFGIPLQKSNSSRGNYMASFDCVDAQHLHDIKIIISEGLTIFKELFGYDSKTIIAPCYIWPKEIEPHLSGLGIKGYQGISYQFKPDFDNNTYRKKYHFTGQSNKSGQKYLVRNAFFEPTHFPTQDMVADIIQRMRIAFFWKKPLIVGTHRINFVGSLDEANRKKNLQKFDLLLKAILKECPEVEFMSSDELVGLMLNDDKQ